LLDAIDREPVHFVSQEIMRTLHMQTKQGTPKGNIIGKPIGTDGEGTSAAYSSGCWIL
jgi:hypothetical protein